ncbi:type IV toxin-antitoxin system AbiEi family antitoxin [Sinomonas flava]|uniref:AbiEi antitoxin C-terminal domain-containing protein n=1 Tax=Sinomonas flava TaxID=496857 RepID=A0ABN3BMA9_9MICC
MATPLHPAPASDADPPVLVAGGPFTAVELQAMEHDGVLRRLIADAYVPIQCGEAPELRARGLAAILAPRLVHRTVVGRLTAAWVYGCAGRPDTPVLLVDGSRRMSTLRATHRLLVHEVYFGPFDVVELAGVRVTSPLRTAVDLAIHSEEGVSVPVLRRMLAQPRLGLTVGLVARGLDALPRQPHLARARRVIARVAGAPAS